MKKVRSSSREKSPLVSFKEDSEVYDFQERQYQTVHAGRYSLPSALIWYMRPGWYSHGVAFPPHLFGTCGRLVQSRRCLSSALIGTCAQVGTVTALPSLRTYLVHARRLVQPRRCLSYGLIKDIVVVSSFSMGLM